ncbi:MAG: 7-cyano-7-deazaguanine synthase [Gemmataceae bacterium]
MMNTNHEPCDGWPVPAPPESHIAVLISGGLDSAVLLAEALRRHVQVYPLYVRTGLFWEAVETRWLHRYLQAIACAALRPLQVLQLPVTDLYGPHWSLTGQEVPDADSPDEAVFLPGRNVLLLAKTLLWCHLHDVPAVAMALLSANPFPDATPAFLQAYQEAVNQAVGGHVRVFRPYAGLNKTQVVRRGQQLPLELTFSCIRPHGEHHCGQCNKCAERRRAFAAAGIADATFYASEKPCIA